VLESLRCAYSRLPPRVQTYSVYVPGRHRCEEYRNVQAVLCAVRDNRDKPRSLDISTHTPELIWRSTIHPVSLQLQAHFCLSLGSDIALLFYIMMGMFFTVSIKFWATYFTVALKYAMLDTCLSKSLISVIHGRKKETNPDNSLLLLRTDASTVLRFHYSKAHALPGL
jgi:hypothetical protein